MSGSTRSITAAATKRNNLARRRAPLSDHARPQRTAARYCHRATNLSPMSPDARTPLVVPKRSLGQRRVASAATGPRRSRLRLDIGDRPIGDGSAGTFGRQCRDIPTDGVAAGEVVGLAPGAALVQQHGRGRGGEICAQNRGAR